MESVAAMTVLGPPSWLSVAAHLSVGIAVLACNVMLFDLLRPSHARRWPLYAAVALLGWESIACFFAGSAEWTEQWFGGTAVGIHSVHVRFAIELCAIGALNVLASLLLLLRRWGWVWWFAIGMQCGIFVLAQIEAQLIDPNSPGWSALSPYALLSLFLLLAFRLAKARPRSAIDRVLTPP